MKMADDLLALLDCAAARLTLPRVAALHLPHPDLAGGKEGEFCALELEGGAIGLSYVLLDDTLARLVEGRDGHPLAGSDALSVARWYRDDDGVKRTIGFATINALTRWLFDRAGFVPGPSADSIGGLAPAAGEHVGMVGFFTPLIPKVVASGAKLTVLELKAELAGAHPGFDVTLDPADLAHCDKVLSTSTVLLNDTLDRVLDACRSARRVALIGPSAGCLPDPLFARGVSFVGGSWITDSPGFVKALVSGESWGKHARKFGLAAEDYPGFDALLRRACA